MPYNDFKNNELPQHTNLGTGYKRLFMEVQVDDILSTVDYCDTVAKQVCLVHEVGGEDDGAASLVLDQQVPDGSPGVGVHPRGGLVQYNHPELLLLLLCFSTTTLCDQSENLWIVENSLGSADKGASDAELPLHSPGKILALLVPLVRDSLEAPSCFFVLLLIHYKRIT